MYGIFIFRVYFRRMKSAAIDQAKLGRSYFKKGILNTDTILSESFIRDATRRDISEGISPKGACGIMNIIPELARRNTTVYKP